MHELWLYYKDLFKWLYSPKPIDYAPPYAKPSAAPSSLPQQGISLSDMLPFEKTDSLPDPAPAIEPGTDLPPMRLS